MWTGPRQRLQLQPCSRERTLYSCPPPGGKVSRATAHRLCAGFGVHVSVLFGRRATVQPVPEDGSCTVSAQAWDTLAACILCCLLLPVLPQLTYSPALPADFHGLRVPAQFCVKFVVCCRSVPEGFKASHARHSLPQVVHSAAAADSRSPNLQLNAVGSKDATLRGSAAGSRNPSLKATTSRSSLIRRAAAQGS